eukprot:scaffold70145_cov40-Cyclotella_meneghiniana.AAC.3
MSRGYEGVELKELIVIRFLRWIESNTNQVVIVTGKGWGWVGFCSGVSKVERCVDPVEVDSACSDFLVDELDWYCNVLDSCCYGVGFESVDTRLAIKIDWEREYVGGWMPDVGVDVLEITCFFSGCKGSNYFAMSGMEGNGSLLLDTIVYKYTI